MFQKILLRLAVNGGLVVAAFGQTTAVPDDRLELATGNLRKADTPESRRTALNLLARARTSYTLRGAARAYDLKVSFTVDSGRQTDYDGAWTMEDRFDPSQGLHWTAEAAAGFRFTGISSKESSYGQGTAATIPLRLQEARAALFSPLPDAANLKNASIRTSAASFNGTALTCILISGSGNAAAPAGRSWEETEACIDPKSGLLRVYSQVPGRYYAYEYSDGLRVAGHAMPEKVTVSEGGKAVSTISVDSLTELPALSKDLFVPAAEMKAAGEPVAMGPAQKISRFAGSGPFTAGTAIRPVCVFGLVTPAGQLVELHSLQPGDPNSAAALADVAKMSFPPEPSGARPQQHFIFIIEKFAAANQADSAAAQ